MSLRSVLLIAPLLISIASYLVATVYVGPREAAVLLVILAVLLFPLSLSSALVTFPANASVIRIRRLLNSNGQRGLCMIGTFACGVVAAFLIYLMSQPVLFASAFIALLVMYFAILLRIALGIETKPKK